MKHVKSVAAAAMAGWLLAAALPALAQDAAPEAAADAPPIVEIYTDADAKAVLDARIAALKTVLELTPDQEKLWPPVEAAIRRIATDAGTRGKTRGGAEPPMDFLDVLERIADAEATRAAELKSFVAAARPLAAALTEEQKRRAPAFLGMVDDPSGPQPTGSLWLFEEEVR